MAVKLTNRQRDSLEYASMKPDGKVCGYELKGQGIGDTGTLNQLSWKGFVTPVGPSHMAFPANAKFQITAAGRAALAEDV